MDYNESIEYCFNIIKAFWKKGDIKVCIYRNIICCMDIDDSILYKIDIKDTEIILATLKSQLELYVKKEISSIYHDYSIENIIMNKYNEYKDLSECIYNEYNCNENQLYTVPLSLKTDDGCKFININGLIIPMFYGFINMAKADSLSHIIYKYNDISFVSKFTLHKKKIKSDVDIYTRLLYIPNTN